MLSLMETGVSKKNMRRAKYVQFFALAALIATSVVGCNIFNPLLFCLPGRFRINDTNA